MSSVRIAVYSDTDNDVTIEVPWEGTLRDPEEGLPDALDLAVRRVRAAYGLDEKKKP